MKYKSSLAMALALILSLTLLAACGDSTTPAAADPPSSVPLPASTNLSITVVNDTSYVFYELYVTPTGDNSWGTDHLGSSSVLKKNGSYPIQVPKYDFENYDVRIVDEDDDVYTFDRVALKNGTTLHISLDGDGLNAVSVHGDGTESVTTGSLESIAQGSDPGDGIVDDGIFNGYDCNGLIQFSVYNNSNYDIYAIFIGLSSASADEDIDILPQVLPARSSTSISVTVGQQYWGDSEWTMYVTDVDGDTSTSYDKFDPWNMSYVDIDWSGTGYDCDFFYP